MIGSVRLVLHLPGCRSLKEKRNILRRYLEAMRRSYGVSIAEIEGQDEHQRAVLEAACAANARSHLHSVLTRVARDADRPGEMTLTDYEIEV
ncbi:MAG TPA: DUF503 domain-containing protein [candidate division Zixibacteria bacterium]|jgi:hypothetical protein